MIEYSIRLVDHVRMLLGDRAKDFFTEEQLKSFIEKHTWVGEKSDETLRCHSKHFRSSYPGPVNGLVIESGADPTATYRIDESIKHIEWISGDTEPEEDDELHIEYWTVEFNELMVELFSALATMHRKLAMTQSVGGLSVDTSNLAKEFYEEAVRWSCMEDW